MAEIAAGAVVAEQVVSTAVEGGAIAGYAVAKPTMPLSASLTQISKAFNDDITLALARSNHTVTLIGGKAYVFGGSGTDDRLTSNDIYSIKLPTSKDHDADYQTHAAEPLEQGHPVPSARTRHAACSRGKHVVVHGGRGGDGSVIQEDSALWLWDSERSKWAQVGAETSGSGPSELPAARSDHHVFADESQDIVILHGGQTNQSEPATDTWLFEFDSRKWIRLADAPAVAGSAAFVGGNLYTITGHSDVSSEMHILHIGNTETERKANANATWQTVSFPTNPLTPGPRPREASALLPVTTGLGRQYLIYIFGRRQASAAASEEASEKSPYYSDIWTLQLPSKSVKPASWTDIKPAMIKDAIREKLGYDSGTHSWGEVDVQPSEQVGHEGKVHPGPRGFFGADVSEDGKSVVLWGGVNAKGEKESDGWIIHLS